MEKKEKKFSITFGVKDIAKEVLTEIREQGDFNKTALDDLVPEKHAMRILTVSRNTLYRFEKSGYLTPVRIGAKRMYRYSDLGEILRGERAKPKKTQK